METDKSTIEPVRSARRQACAAVIALLLSPLYYAWVPFAYDAARMLTPEVP